MTDLHATPRRSARALPLLAGLALGLVAGGAAVWVATRAPSAPPSAAPVPQPPPKKEVWQCPMHPAVVSDHPDNCPICGMKLVKVEAAAPADHGAQAGGEQAAHGAEAGSGLATITIDPARQQLIGLKTAEVTRGPVSGAFRTTGRVAVDETRVHHLNVKVSGFVEHVHADFTGRAVRAGEPLFSLYSPELLVAQEELILALQTRDALAGGGQAGSGDDLVAAARRKLQLWDVPADEVARLERTRQASRTLTVRSPASGVVVKKDVVPGMKVAAGDMPYEIVDLSQLWVLADVYERELKVVKLGTRARLTFQAIPGEERPGTVTFVDPYLDARARTARVRIAVANADGRLKPEMFAEVELRGTSREALRIPADAVIDSGRASVVFVDLGQGRFEPRAVKLGDGDGEQVEVVEGLAAGEKVVTRANFLVDSESRLKASLQAIGGTAP